jgi:integrase
LSSEGSVFRRKDGKWCAKWKDASGKWKYLYRKTKAEAKQALREALKDRDDNIIPADRLTLNDALDQWLDEQRDRVSLRTWTNRESLVRMHVKTHPISAVRLTKLDANDLRAFYRAKSRTLSPATVGRLHDVVKKSINPYVKSKRIRMNPADDVKPPKEHQRELDVLKPEQLNRLLETVRGSRYEGIIVLGACCALRIGEALSLRYEDTDLTAGTISIRRTLWKGNVYPPKTPQSRRTLQLPSVAREWLVRHREAHGNPTTGYLFQTSNNTPIANENFWRWGWKPALRKAGLDEGLHYHDLRHGAISLLLQQGIPVPVVSQFAGHADPAITMKVYAHVIAGTSGMAAAGMDAVLSNRHQERHLRAL